MTTEVDVFSQSMEAVEALKPFMLENDANSRYSTAIEVVTDINAEYTVQVRKHYFKNHCIVQYGVKNTVEDQVLSQVALKILGLQAGSTMKVEGVVSLTQTEQIRNGDLKFVYVILSREGSICSCKIQQKLQFVITEVDVDTEEEIGSYEEDYDFPEVTLGVRDLIKAEPLITGQFKELWEKLGTGA